jgi:glycosyltransferase involved in cell wall biosynthesis
MKLVIIIPALNEEKTIVSVINRIPQNIPGISTVETIVVDDGSSDKTASLAQQAGAHIVRHPHNLGVGAAFQTGITEALKADADIIVNIDADGQFNPQDIPQVIAPIMAHQAEFVTASRFATQDIMPQMPALNLWGNKCMVNIVNLLTAKRFSDVSCGFRAYSREAALKLTLFGHFTYTQETFIDLARKDISMTEVPLKVQGVREHGRSRVADNLWRYGIKAATIIFRAARDYHPFYFFGFPGLLITTVGLGCAVFLVIHYFQTGQTFPYRGLTTISGTLILVGIILLVLSMLADMLHRNRIIAEQILYLTKKQHYSRDRSQQ